MTNSEENDFITYIEEKTKKYKGCLLFFNASWCKPCKKIKDIFYRNIGIIKENNINIIIIDIDTNIDQYGNNVSFYSFLKKKRIIRGVPSLLLYKQEDSSNDNVIPYPDFSCESDINHFNALLEIITHL